VFVSIAKFLLPVRPDLTAGLERVLLVLEDWLRCLDLRFSGRRELASAPLRKRQHHSHFETAVKHRMSLCWNLIETCCCVQRSSA